MRKSFFTVMIAVCTMIAADASAQHRNRPSGMNPDGDRPTTEEMARMRTERMTEALSLDENQARTVYKQCLREAQLQQQLVDVKQENAEKMKQILNEEQYAKWQKMRKTRMRHGPEPRVACDPEAAQCCDAQCPAKKEGSKRHRAKERRVESER